MECELKRRRGVSIPLEQGNVFRLEGALKNAGVQVSIPLEQGNVFRRRLCIRNGSQKWVSIPLEQGNVFRPSRRIRLN